MAELDSQQIIEYFHRCYKAVDGLWFMKVEEKIGFAAATKQTQLYVTPTKFTFINL